MYFCHYISICRRFSTAVCSPVSIGFLLQKLFPHVTHFKQIAQLALQIYFFCMSYPYHIPDVANLQIKLLVGHSGWLLH